MIIFPTEKQTIVAIERQPRQRFTGLLAPNGTEIHIQERKPKIGFVDFEEIYNSRSGHAGD